MSVRTTTSKIGPIKKDKSTTSRKAVPYITDPFGDFNKTKSEILPVKRSISENVGKVMKYVTNRDVISDYYSSNSQLDTLLNPRTSTGAFSKKVPSNDELYRKLWSMYIKANNLIITYSPSTDINFFQKREDVIINDTDVLILFLNVHGASLTEIDSNLLGIHDGVNYCETSLTRHGEPRSANRALIEDQRVTCTRIAENITCEGGFCSQYINEIQSRRDEILTSMYSRIDNSNIPDKFQNFIKGVKSSCPTYVTTRCNKCVNNKRYSYKTSSDPGKYNMLVISDTSGNMPIGTSLLNYNQSSLNRTFTTQDIINQAYAIGYRNIGIISGACLNYTQSSSNEINTRAVELSHMETYRTSDVTDTIGHSKSLIKSFSVKRGGVKNKKNKRTNRKKNKTMKRKRYRKH
jgi:hypothetical protein